MYHPTIIFILLSFFMTTLSQAQIGIGTMNPESSAKLDITSTTKGFLPPRMSDIQRNAIVSPVAGLLIWCTNCGLYGEIQVYNGNAWVNVVGGAVSPVITITSPATGKVWMDRNLGATQVATSSTDYLAYGSLYQWGRGSDDHQLVTWNSSTGTIPNTTSSTTTTLSTTDAPGNTNFILSPNAEPFDWRSPQNSNLWQDASGINNPCPSGYRIPTEAEWNAEISSWGSPKDVSAFNSLKLPLAGFRGPTGGSLNNTGTRARYWTSTVNSTYSKALDFNASIASVNFYYRANGFCVRCIKN